MTPEQELAFAMLDWRDGLTSNIIRIIIVSIVFAVLLLLFFVLGFLRAAVEDWPRYRCKPIVMPFASMFGYDASENFAFCINQVFQSKANQAFAPVYEILAKFAETSGQLATSTMATRSMFNNFVGGMNGYMRNTRDRLQGLLFQIRLSYMKLQNLMARVYGTMYSIVWMGTSAITSGYNVSENDLVQFIFDFCFHPDTEVCLAAGGTRRIADIRIGDHLVGAKGQPVAVTSVFRFAGDRTPMVRVDGVTVSAQHYVQLPEGGWVPAGRHPDAQPVASVPEIVCLNVEDHAFVTASGLVVADYDETEEAQVVTDTQHVAERALNGCASVKTQDTQEAMKSYALGVEEASQIRMADGTWKAVTNVRLGDHLEGENIVLGLVSEATEAVCIHPATGLALTPAQLLFHAGRWQRAATVFPVRPTHAILHQFITSRTGPLLVRKEEGGESVWIRDYREVPLPEMEAAYVDALTDARY